MLLTQINTTGKNPLVFKIPKARRQTSWLFASHGTGVI